MRFFILIIILTGSFSLSGQIRLNNPSFEGQPQDASTPDGWIPCNKGTTPDILPGFWGVYQEPADGESYMGLITRDDGTWESVGQKLPSPLKGGECYSLSLDLARSPTYAEYNLPLIFRIWGGRSECGRDQLLSESEAISHTEWKTYEFGLYPKRDFDYIVFEAYYATGKFYQYRGNLLLDDCSIIMPCQRASLF